MDLTITNSLAGSLSALTKARTERPFAPIKNTENIEARQPAQNRATGTRVISENREDLEQGGYRLTRTFEREDGRTFTKIEELALTLRGARKTVLQQNPSGSISRYEEVLDREEGGTFRRTQRFQEGDGDVITSITPNYKITDSFVLTGIQASTPLSSTGFAPTRGTQLDLSA